MYRSHPVRRLCEDPLPDESVTLVVELVDDADDESLARVLSELGGRVEATNRFSHTVSLPQTAVADLCDRDDLLVRVETANTISLGLDDGAESGEGDRTRDAHRD